MNEPNPDNFLYSFYKICFDASAINLRLPTLFMKKLHVEGKVLENPVLQIETGQKWRVEIEKIGEDVFFGNGWLEFVKDTKIQDLDFLIFRLIANSHFQVSVYHPNSCVKDLSSAIPTKCFCSCSRSRNTGASLNDAIEIEEDDDDNGNINVEEHDDQEVNEETDNELQSSESTEKSTKPCFQKLLMRYNNYYLELPPEFAAESGLGNERKTIMRNKAGKEWQVTVKTRRDGRVNLSRGWLKCRKENKLMDGDICFFEYFPGQGSRSGFIQFDIVKNAARKMERPRRLYLGFCRSSRFRITNADLNDANKIEEEDDDQEVDEEKDSELQPFESNENLCFQKVLRRFNAYYIELPSEFATESGLRNERETILRNKAGREWPVTIKIWTRNRVCLSRGWFNFKKVNKLMAGDTISLKYFHGEAGRSGFIQVDVVKKAVRRRGRPLLIRLRR